MVDFIVGDHVIVGIVIDMDSVTDSIAHDIVGHSIVAGRDIDAVYLTLARAARQIRAEMLDDIAIHHDMSRPSLAHSMVNTCVQ